MAQSKKEIAWRLRYMARMVERGLTVKYARMTSQGAEYDPAESPADNADDEITYMEL